LRKLPHSAPKPAAPTSAGIRQGAKVSAKAGLTARR
jgi:hypothetical protein